MTKASIQKLIAQDQVPSALEQMMALLNAYLLLHPKDMLVAKLQQVLITNNGKFKGLEQDQALGILKREDAQVTLAEVKKAILYLLDELPEQVWQTKPSATGTPMATSKTSSDFEYDIFLSFSSKDRDAARLLWETLRGLGYRVFLSDEALKAYAGMSFLDKINTALRQSQHFLLLCTPNAVESHWVKLECETFFTHFHLPAAQQRRFFIFERGGKKSLAEVYRNVQTLEELPHLIELLQSLNGQSSKAPIIATPTKVDHQLTPPEKAIEARLKQEQTQLEQAASVEVRTSPLPSNADLTAVKNSALLIDFYQKYGEKATATQLLQLHETIVQTFGDISELELDDLITNIGDEKRKREKILNDLIPKTIQVYVAEHKGEWSRREELLFLDQLSKRFENILDKPTITLNLDKARTKYFKSLEEFVSIKGGVFLMGAPDDEPESKSDEKPQNEVKIFDFHMSKYPVTVAQFSEFIEATDYMPTAYYEGGSYIWTGKWEKAIWVDWSYDANGKIQNNSQHPVIHVSWHDAKAYCEWLSEKLLMPIRLPREAEWEYACRSGSITPFNTGDNLSTDQANYNGNYTYLDKTEGRFLNSTTPIGSYPPNAWGLYDMHGNVWEWCEDWYNETYYGTLKNRKSVLNPKGFISGNARVLRGGSWYSNASNCRSANRRRNVPLHCCSHVGFRPVISSW